MLKIVDLPNSFWVKAAKTTYYVINRLPSITISVEDSDGDVD